MTRGEARLIAVQVVWKKRPRSSPDLVERVAIALQEAYTEGLADGKSDHEVKLVDRLEALAERLQGKDC